MLYTGDSCFFDPFNAIFIDRASSTGAKNNGEKGGRGP